MGAVVKGVGAVISAVGQIKAGKAANQSAQIEAANEEDNARAALAQGAETATRVRRAGEQQQGDVIAALAGNGIDIMSASALDAVRDTARVVELDAQDAIFAAQAEATGRMREAARLRREGKAAKNAGYWGAASTIFSAAGDIYSSTRKKKGS